MTGLVLPALDLLLRQYVRVSSDLVDLASPQDNLVSSLSSDWRYERALQGIRLLVQHHVGQLVQTLMAWRQSVNEEIKKAYGSSGGSAASAGGVVTLNLQGVCKRAAMEIMFLEASQVVLEEFQPDFLSDRAFVSFFDHVQRMAFRRLLGSEDFVPQPELASLRNHIVALGARLVAAMSRIRLKDITQEFMVKLDERLAPRKDIPPIPPTAGGSPSGGGGSGSAVGPTALRAQLLKLCHGMCGVVLSFEDDAQLAASTDFLKRSHPLSHTAPVKKSQVHHALCEMLADVLRPLVRANLPAANAANLSPHLLSDWYVQVLRVKNEIGQWVNKHNKHINVGYPLVSLLVCLVEEAQYTRQMDAMADFLVKQMKVKEYRTLCFRCLGQLLASYLIRTAAPGPLSPQHAAWLDKSVKPALVTARKGGLVPAQEQLDFVAELADLSPEYAVGTVVFDMLQQADSPEAQTIALRALQLVLTSVPAGKVTEALGAAALGTDAGAGGVSSPTRLKHSAGAFTQQQQQPGRRMVQVSLQVALQLVRAGRHPLELQGIAHLLPRIQSTLAALLAAGHRAFGSATSWSGETVPKDKAPQAVLLGWLLRLLPLLKPEGWTGQPLELLPGYTAHAEGQLRMCALDALQSVMRSAPGLRGTVLVNVAKFLASIPDEALQATRECSMLLRNLMQLWLTFLMDEGSGASLATLAAGGALNLARAGAGAVPQVAVVAAPGAAELDLQRIEGILFVLLCSYDDGLRRDAYDSLALLRTLHRRLQQQREGTAAAAAAAAAAGASSRRDPPLGGQGDAGGDSGGPGRPGVHHAPSASRDSIDFVRALAGLEAQQPLPGGTTYLIDVLEEVGTDAARRCYWDFGDWSDVWRESKPVPVDLALENVMSASDDVGCLRWARCAIELARSAAAMCPGSMGVAHVQALAKLQRYVTRDAAGRVSLPLDPGDGRASEAWRASLAVPCVVPPALAERVERVPPRKGPGASLSARDIVRALLAALYAGVPPLHQQLYIMALGHCRKEHYPLLSQELPALIDEYQRPSSSRQRARSAGRPEETRKLVANILRIVANAAAAGAITSQSMVVARYIEWIRDTQGYMRGIPPFSEDFWEASQVAYCLCSVVRSLAGQLAAAQHQLVMSMAQPPLGAVEPGGSQGVGGAASPLAGAGGKASDTSVSGAAAAATAGLGGAGMGCADRKALWELLALWCEDGKGHEGSDYSSRLASGITQALARLKDLDAEGREAVKAELQQFAEMLDAAARCGMAAMLQGPAFDADARRAQGPVLQWADRLLRGGPSPSAPPGAAGRMAPARHDGDGSKGHHRHNGHHHYGGAGPPKAHVARVALGHLLRFNLDMFSVCVDRCYHPDGSIATGYFQVVSEVYALHVVPCEPHVVLSLVLYKMVDPGPEVREDALHMLHVLSTREWQHSSDHLGQGSQGRPGTGALVAAADSFGGRVSLKELLEGWEDALRGGSSSVVVLGALQDSYQQFQYQLSAKLARDHPELSEQLCEEMMTRQLECADKVMQHPVLTCLAPWMENLSIAAHWKGTWCERLLKSMYYVTLRHGSELPLEIERLWSTLAGNRRNIIPVLDFLVSLGMHVAFQELGAVLEYFSVAQRICLYLARISPQQTIDHLVYEVSLGLHEDYSATEGFFIGASTGSRMERSESGGVFTSQQSLRQQSSSRLGSSLEFASLMVEPGPGSGAISRGSTSLLAAASNRLAASLELRNSAGSGAWLFSPSGGGAGGGGPAAAAGTSLGRVSASASACLGQDDAGSLASPSLAQKSDSDDTSRSAVGAGALGGGGGSVQGGAGGVDGAASATVADSVTSSGGWAGLGLGLSGLGLPGLGLSGLGLSGLGLGLGSIGSSLAQGLPKSVSFGAVRVSKDAPSTASWDDTSSIGLPLPPPGGAALGAGIRRNSSGRGAGPAGGGAMTRGVSGDLMSPAIRTLLTRPELALCLLTEVAYEHDEDFEGHLALLLHVVVLSMDSDEPMVVGAAQALLVNTLYSLSARHVELRHAEGLPADVAQVSQLIQYLQSLRGRRLWPYEDPSLERPHPQSADALASLAEHLLGALAFEPGLRAAWCDVALEWALHCRSRHLASRSQQVLRTLTPALNGDLCGTLLRCMLQCLEPALQSSVARETALELVLTLTALVKALPPGRLVLFPQVLWAAVALLSTDYVHVHRHAVGLLSVCLVQLPLHDATVQSVLLASAPIGSSAPAALAAAAGGGGGGGAAGALAGLAMLTPRQGGGGAGGVEAGGAIEGAAGPPVPWGVGQLLPWREGTPVAQVLALQQLLWKGLLFADSRLPTVRLLSQLAAHLSHLHVPSSRGASPALSGRFGGPPPRPGTPGGGLRSQGRARAAHSRTSSMRSSGGFGVGDGGGSGSGSRVPSSTPSSGAAGLGASAAPSPATFAGQMPLPLPPLHEQPDATAAAGSDFGVSGSAEAPLVQDAHSVLSRSAPELGGISRRAPGSSGGTDIGGAGPGTPQQLGTALAAGQGRPPPARQRAGEQQQRDQELDRFRTAPLPSRSKGRQRLPPAWPGGIAASVAAAGCPAPYSATWSWQRGGGGAGALRRGPGVRRVYQALFGHRHAQLAVTTFALVPLACAHLQAPPAAAAAAPELAGALQEALLTLAAACGSQGLQDLGTELEVLADARAKDLGALLPRLAARLARAFFPHYAEWLLRSAAGGLLLPGAGALHAPLLALLRCLFQSPGLDLGPAALALLVGDSSVLGPIVALSQGPLCHQALAALDAVTTYVASSQEAAVAAAALQRQQQQAAAAGGAGGKEGSAPAAASPAPSAPAIEQRVLMAGVLPQLDVHATLQRVLDGCGVSAPAKKRKFKLLPFIAASTGDAPRRFTDD